MEGLSSLGPGRATAQLENALEEIDVAEDMAITTQALLDLDDDPNEWFFDVIIRSEDGSVSFGIFDSSFMFVEGPPDLERAVVSEFVDTTEVDWAIDT